MNFKKGNKLWKKRKPYKHSKKIIEKLRKLNTGKNNPMYGKPAWNKGLTKATDNRIKTTKTAFKKGNTPHNKGKTKENYKILKIVGEKLSITNKGRISHRKGLNLEKEYCKEKAKKIKEKMSKIRKNKTYEELYGKDKSKEWKQKIGKASKKIWENQEFKEKRSKAMKELWKDKEFIKKIQKSNWTRPTSFEKILNKLLQKNFPNEWKYVGDGSFWIGKGNPDFINVNGKKIAIEVFFSFFKVRNFGSIKNYKVERRKNFKKYGWDVIFIDENELFDEELCLNKLRGE